MEEKLGHDFSGVRVHTDSLATQSTADVNARAYTVKGDIVFGAGRFGQETHEKRKLITHELVHVVQQGSARFLHTSCHQSTQSTRAERDDAGETQTQNFAQSATVSVNLSSPVRSVNASLSGFIQRDMDEDLRRAEETRILTLRLRRANYSAGDIGNASTQWLLSSAYGLFGLFGEFARHPALSHETADIAASLLAIHEELLVRSRPPNSRSPEGILVYMDYYRDAQHPGGVAVPWTEEHPREVRDISIFSAENVRSWQMLLEFEQAAQQAVRQSRVRLGHSDIRLRLPDRPVELGPNPTEELGITTGNIPNLGDSLAPPLEIFAAPHRETPAEEAGRNDGFLTLGVGLSRLEQVSLQQIEVVARQYFGNLRQTGRQTSELQVIEEVGSDANLLGTCGVLFFASPGPYPRIYPLDRSGHILNSDAIAIEGASDQPGLYPGVYYSTQVASEESEIRRGMMFSISSSEHISILEGLNYGNIYFSTLRNYGRFNSLIQQAYSSRRGVALIVGSRDNEVHEHEVRNLTNIIGYAMGYIPWAINRTLRSVFSDIPGTVFNFLIGMVQERILAYVSRLFPMLSGLIMGAVLLDWFMQNIVRTAVFASTEEELGFSGQALTLFVTEELMEELIGAGVERGLRVSSDWARGRPPRSETETEGSIGSEEARSDAASSTSTVEQEAVGRSSDSEMALAGIGSDPVSLDAEFAHEILEGMEEFGEPPALDPATPLDPHSFEHDAPADAAQPEGDSVSSDVSHSRERAAAGGGGHAVVDLPIGPGHLTVEEGTCQFCVNPCGPLADFLEGIVARTDLTRTTREHLEGLIRDARAHHEAGSLATQSLLEGFRDRLEQLASNDSQLHVFLGDRQQLLDLLTGEDIGSSVEAASAEDGDAHRYSDDENPDINEEVLFDDSFMPGDDEVVESWAGLGEPNLSLRESHEVEPPLPDLPTEVVGGRGRLLEPLHTQLFPRDGSIRRQIEFLARHASLLGPRNRQRFQRFLERVRDFQVRRGRFPSESSLRRMLDPRRTKGREVRDLARMLVRYGEQVDRTVRAQVTAELNDMLPFEVIGVSRRPSGAPYTVERIVAELAAAGASESTLTMTARNPSTRERVQIDNFDITNMVPKEVKSAEELSSLLEESGQRQLIDQLRRTAEFARDVDAIRHYEWWVYERYMRELTDLLAEPEFNSVRNLVYDFIIFFDLDNSRRL
jgi:hypothetical protein